VSHADEDDFSAARRLFLEGVGHFEAGRLDEAHAAFEASLQRLPGRPSTLVNLAATRLRLGDPQAALAPLDEALAASPHDADAWSHRARALAHLGRYEEAVHSADRALGIEPSHAAAGYERAMNLMALQRHDQALPALEALLAREPDLAEAWMRRGQALQALNRHDEALPCYDRAVAADPRLAQAWTLRGGLLKDMGRTTEAIDAFRRALALGGDAGINGYFLAGLTGEDVPRQAPVSYVEQLFDGYAGEFDHHLVEVLRYGGPRILVEGLVALQPAGASTALDLGCGTGLCGPLLRPHVQRLDGVDLSAAMLDKARATGAYDGLAKGELVTHLRGVGSPQQWLVAADVFVYVGALEAVFEAAASVLAPGGLFAFSVEEAQPGEPPLALRPSLRYAHSQTYLEGLAQAHGLTVRRWQRAPLREDQRRAIPGLFGWLEKKVS
jgi:predicted TPR repeat methyltransferase